MKRRRPSQQSIGRFTSRIGPDDGIDPRTAPGHRSSAGRAGRKTAQLCH
jgi:hypothetical protein